MKSNLKYGASALAVLMMTGTVSMAKISETEASNGCHAILEDLAKKTKIDLLEAQKDCEKNLKSALNPVSGIDALLDGFMQQHLTNQEAIDAISKGKDNGTLGDATPAALKEKIRIAKLKSSDPYAREETGSKVQGGVKMMQGGMGQHMLKKRIN